MASNAPTVKLRRVPLWIWSAVVPIILFTSGLAYLVWIDWQASQAFRNRITQIREAGIPIDNASSAKWYRQHTHPEGAERWTAILEMLNRNVGINHLPILGDQRLPMNLDPSEPWADLENVENYLRDTRVIRDEIKLAVQSPVPVGFPIQFKGVDTLLPFVQDARTVHRYLQLDFEAAYYTGDTKRALEDLQMMAGVANAFELELFLVSRMVTMALNSNRDGCILRSMPAGRWSEEELIELQRMLATSHFSNEKLKHAFYGERAMGIDFLENGSDFGHGANLSTMFATPSQKLQVLTLYGELDELAKTPIGRLSEAANLLELQLKEATLSNLFAAQIFPVSFGIVHAEIRTENTRKWARTAVGLRLYKIKFGNWPEQLSELSGVGYSSMDYSIVNGIPFGYEVTNSTAYLWSIPHDSIEVIHVERPTRETTERSLNANEPIPNLVEMK